MADLDRRSFLASAAALSAGVVSSGSETTAASGTSGADNPETGSVVAPDGGPRASEFQFRYIVASCMYGYMYVGEILPEIARCGSGYLDVWPKRHGNQREQLEDMGEELFASLLGRHNVRLGCLTQYALGPFGLTEEFQVANRFGCSLIVTGGAGPKGLTGAEQKSAVARFVEQMKPHIAAAEEAGVTIAIENHPGNVFESADALRHLRDLRPSPHLAVALAPHHLPQDSELLAALIRDLGDSISMFYAWQYGNGSMTKLPKDEELLQLPGRGNLDFRPLVSALMDIRYQGWTEIFMHPVPRGIPILETAAEVTGAISQSVEYLNECISARSLKQQ